MTHIVRDTFDISGFGLGDDYEHACQRMLWRGARYLAQNRVPTAIWQQPDPAGRVEVIGVPERHTDRSLIAAMMEGDDYGFSGGQVDAVLQHLRYMHEHGVDAWRAELAANRTEPGDRFTWEGEI